MIVYRSQESTVATAEAIANLRSRFDAMQKQSRPPHEAVQRMLIDFGEFESGAADALGSPTGAESRVRAAPI